MKGKLYSILFCALAISACSSKNEPAADIAMAKPFDNSYMPACDLVRADAEKNLKCKTDSEFRKTFAEGHAAAQAAVILELAKINGEKVLENAINERVTEAADNLNVDELPFGMIGVDPKGKGLPVYYYTEASLYAFEDNNEVSVKIADKHMEAFLDTSLLSTQQKAFLLDVCEPDNDHTTANCQGTVYTGVISDGNAVRISLVGAELMSLTESFLKDIELKRLW